MESSTLPPGLLISTWIIRNSSPWEICTLPQFIYIVSLLFKSVWTLGYLLCTLGYSEYYFNYFVAQNLPVLALGNSFSWFLFSFDIIPSVPVCVCVRLLFCWINISSLSGTTRVSRFILYISCSRPRMIYFSKEHGFFSLANTFNNSNNKVDLNASIATGECLFLGFSADSVRKFLYVLTYVCPPKLYLPIHWSIYTYRQRCMSIRNNRRLY